MRHWMQITSGRGPAECCWVVARILEQIEREAAKSGVKVDHLDAEPGEESGTYKSVLLALESESLDRFREKWNGTILWIGASPFRPRHKRKNWYAGVSYLLPPEQMAYSEKDFQFEAMRASGPGGQHINKTSSAVRVTHVPTGLAATAREERSQHQNRKLAMARIAVLLDAKERQKGLDAQQSLWDQHNSLERGNPVRTFTGEKFVEKI